jgi:hypothetical protein
MPFTLSHAAVVLPFARRLNRWRALSAAVIGSMVPDFAMLIPWHVGRLESHSGAGLIRFCLPIGLLSYWLFEYAVKPTAREVLPDAAYQRALALSDPDPIRSAWQWLVASTAILLGSLTHFGWDAFTHEGTLGVRMFPMLDDQMDIGGHSLFLYHVLQQVSSIIGLAYVAYVTWFEVFSVRGVPAPNGRALTPIARRQWTCGYILTAIFFASVSYGLSVLRRSKWDPPGFSIDAAAVGGLQGLIFSLLSVSLMLRARIRAGAPHQP